MRINAAWHNAESAGRRSHVGLHEKLVRGTDFTRNAQRRPPYIHIGSYFEIRVNSCRAEGGVEELSLLAEDFHRIVVWFISRHLNY